MPTDNTLKVINCYSCKKYKDIIEGFIRDESEVLQQALSVRREQNLLSIILPKDRNAQYWVEMLYTMKKKNEFEFGLGDVMNAVFCYLAAGIDFKAAQQHDTKLIVEYALDELQRMTGGINKVPQEYHYFSSSLDSILNKLETEEKKNGNLMETVEIREEIKHLKEFQQDLKNNPDDFFYAKDFTAHIYMAILNFWDILGDYTYTFRLLACIARMQKWRNDAEGRLTLRNMLIRATENWEYQD